MSDPITPGAGLLGHKLAPPLLGFIGASLQLLYTRELDPRRMAVAVIAGVLSAWIVPPMIVAYASTVPALAFLPAGGSVESLLGLLVGMCSINLVGWWLSVTRNPRDIVPGLPGDHNA